MASVELVRISKTFGNQIALEDVSLKVNSGELLTLLGPSGGGKTTALRIIAGFEKPDSGSVLLDGTDITYVPPNRRDMAMVFQSYNLFPNMTAFENVEFGLKIRHISKSVREKKVLELLELVGIKDKKDSYPHQLSGGQQQRVALARALAVEPKVLLLDEPLSALDAKVRLQLREEIRKIQQNLGITTIYVTHDQEEALSISDKIAVMSTGKIEQVGTPSEIYTSPKSVFVADFVGEMNWIKGRVVDDVAGGIECNGITFVVPSASGKKIGSEVFLLVRPESVLINEINTNGLCAFDGKVESRTFLGPVTRLRLETPIGGLLADVTGLKAYSLNIGQVVSVTFDAANALVIEVDKKETND